jgi:hypothetical protein
LFGCRQRVEGSQDPPDALTFELKQVHTLKLRTPASWGIAKRLQWSKV